MFAKLTTKIALRKAGIPSNALSMPEFEGSKDPNATSPFANVSNPFANLTVPNALKSWATPPPPPIEIAPAPVLGTKAPASNKLRLPALDGRPSVVVFLRHCGCPCTSFAEKHFLNGKKGGRLTKAISRRENVPRAPPPGKQIPAPELRRRLAQLAESDREMALPDWREVGGYRRR
jgi:hypothetical protein